MLDYKNIIIKRYALGLSFTQLAEEFGASKSGVNDFIRAFVFFATSKYLKMQNAFPKVAAGNSSFLHISPA